MLKGLLAAILVALLVLIGLVAFRPGQRSNPLGPLAVNPGAPAADAFVVHNNAPATPPPAVAPAPAASNGTPPAASAAVTTTPADPLSATIQRLRAGKPDATVTVTAPANQAGAVPGTSPGQPVAGPAAASPPDPAPDLPSPTLPSPVLPTPAAPARWSNMTGQGVQFRITRTSDGAVLSIDLGNAQPAEVRVLPAFLALDPAAINRRVDYLKQTILENFAGRSGNYVFNRDGSVSRR